MCSTPEIKELPITRLASILNDCVDEFRRRRGFVQTVKLLIGCLRVK